MKIKGSERRHVRVDRERMEKGNQKVECLHCRFWLPLFGKSSSSPVRVFDTTLIQVFDTCSLPPFPFAVIRSFKVFIPIQVFIQSLAYIVSKSWANPLSEWMSNTHSSSSRQGFHSLILSFNFHSRMERDTESSSLVIIHLNPFLFHPFHYFLYHSLPPHSFLIFWGEGGGCDCRWNRHSSEVTFFTFFTEERKKEIFFLVLNGIVNLALLQNWS